MKKSGVHFPSLIWELGAVISNQLPSTRVPPGLTQTSLQKIGFLFFLRSRTNFPKLKWQGSMKAVARWICGPCFFQPEVNLQQKAHDGFFPLWCRRCWNSVLCLKQKKSVIKAHFGFTGGIQVCKDSKKPSQGSLTKEDFMVHVTMRIYCFRWISSWPETTYIHRWKIGWYCWWLKSSEHHRNVSSTL